MSDDPNFSFPESINTYYKDPLYRGIIDAMYQAIHNGTLSANQLRDAVELAENKDIAYGHRVMPTCTIGPMPGDAFKARADWSAWTKARAEAACPEGPRCEPKPVDEPKPADPAICPHTQKVAVANGCGRCVQCRASRFAAQMSSAEPADPPPKIGETALCDWCGRAIFYRDNRWQHVYLGGSSSHKATPPEPKGLS